MTIGEKIKLLRIERNLTQEELAEAANTKKQTIHKYETGIISNIPASKIKLIADKLGTTPSYLMGWEEETSSSGINQKKSKEDLEFEKLLSTMSKEEKEWLLNVIKSIIEGRK